MEDKEPKKSRAKKVIELTIAEKITAKCKELSDARELVKATEKEYKELLKQKPIEKPKTQDLGELLKVNRNVFKSDPVLKKRMESVANIARIKKQVNK